tara:strand:- start:525 stop:842 length:318 start_codon:yes stop_codon:yes gene_type:complete
MEGATSPVSTFENASENSQRDCLRNDQFPANARRIQTEPADARQFLFLHVVNAKPRDTFARHARAVIAEIVRRGSRRAQLIDHNLVAENSHTPFRVVRAVDLSGI